MNPPGLRLDPGEPAASVDILVAQDDAQALLEVGRNPNVSMRRMVDMDSSDEFDVVFSPHDPSRFMNLPMFPPIIPGPVDAHHPAKQMDAVFPR